MKQPPFFLLTAVLALLIVLGGCEFLDRLREKILYQANVTAESVTKKAREVKDQLEKTRQNVEQKVQDVEQAVKEVNEAVAAVKKVTGTSTGQ